MKLFTFILMATLLVGACSKSPDNIRPPTPPTPPPPEPPVTVTPTVTTEFSTITQTSVTVKGHIGNEGGLPITERSVYWSKGALLTKTKVLASGNGSFEYTITGLTPGDSVYAIASASNAKGEGKGNEVKDRTPLPPTPYVGQDLGYGVIYQVTDSGYYFAAKQDTVSGAGTLEAWAGKYWDNSYPNYFWYGAFSKTDGKANTAKIIAASPTIAGNPAPSAALAAHKYRAGGLVPEGTFFLAADSQMLKLLNVTRSTSVPGLSGTMQGDPDFGAYWTSTEDETRKDMVLSIYYSAQQASFHMKSGGGNIRPIGFKRN